MSYSIYIGEAELGEYEGMISVTVNEIRNTSCSIWDKYDPVRLAHPPEFEGDEMTGRTNGRHPGYSQWGDFCKTVGLTNLFYQEEKGLMSQHPGTVLLTDSHHKKIKHALTKWRKSNPDTNPGWGKGQDQMLARLIWLEWWVKWALDNCKMPAMYNH